MSDKSKDCDCGWCGWCDGTRAARIASGEPPALCPECGMGNPFQINTATPGWICVPAADLDALRADNERLLQLLRESRTHLMQGDHSEWRKRVEAALEEKP